MRLFNSPIDTSNGKMDTQVSDLRQCLNRGLRSFTASHAHADSHPHEEGELQDAIKDIITAFGYDAQNIEFKKI